MNQTKKYTIIGICICLVGIIGIGGYNSFNQDTKKANNKTSVVEKQQETKEPDNEIKQEQETVSVSEENTQTEKKQETSPTVTNKKQVTDNQKKQEAPKEDTPVINDPPVNEVKQEFIQIRVEGIQNTMINQKVQIDSKSTAFSVLKTVCQQNNLKLSTSGYGSYAYVTGIGDLREKEHGNMSGWKYQVNGFEPNVGAGHYELKNNDQVVWYYQYS